MDLSILTDARRSLTVYTGGNKTTPAKRTRPTSQLFHPNLTVIAVAALNDSTLYDVVGRDLCQAEW